MSTAPNVFRTVTVFPARTPFTREFVPLQVTAPFTSAKRIPANELARSAFPPTFDTSTLPLLLRTARSPAVFVTLTFPNDDVMSAELTPSSTTFPLLLEMRLLPARRTETPPNRFERSRAPFRSATETPPFPFTRIASPSWLFRSIFPKEFSRRRDPFPCRKAIEPFEFLTSAEAFKLSTSTLPNLLRASSGAVSGITMS